MPLQLGFTTTVISRIMSGSEPVFSIVLANTGTHDLRLPDIGLRFPVCEISLRDRTSAHAWGNHLVAEVPEVIQAGQTLASTIPFGVLQEIVEAYQLPSPVHFVAWADATAGNRSETFQTVSPVWVAEVGLTSHLGQETSISVRPA